MKLKLTQMMAILLLPAFLLANIGSESGYAWCFGEDGHSEIEQISVKGCGDNQGELNEAVKHETPSLLNLDDECCGPCLDFSAQQAEATFSKRLKKRLNGPVEAISINTLPQVIVQRADLVAGNLASQPPPGISQTILIHRTIVLQI